MDGIPVEIHILQGMGSRVEEVAYLYAVAFKEDAVGGGIDRCAAFPDDASRPVALVADEQTAIKERA